MWLYQGLASRGLATLIHIPLGCIVQGAILGQLPPAVCQQWVACWPERAPLRGPLGLLKRVLLIEVAGTEVLGLRGVVTQSEASGQVGEVPVAESWFWHPGAPFGRWILKLWSEPASTFPSLLGPFGLSM